MVLRSEILTKKSELPTPDQALPGRESAMPVPEAHFVNGRPLTAPFPAGLQQVLFGMGCFWGAERRLWQQPGVWVTAVGYAGGYTPNPTYDEVCSGLTGHSEVVLVVYNPQETSSNSCSRFSGKPTTRPRACARAATSAPSTAR